MQDDDAIVVEKLGEDEREFDAGARKLEQFARTKITQRMAS